ncbi:MAG: hypothetical protein SWY16_19570 [Cyanobacteriota bacterium]|nr:hypothetical protein [Cyanobacteriota bacterium]
MKIHFIDGEKGGIGKSLFSKVLVEYCLKVQYPFALIDTDRTNPDVYNAYSTRCHGELGTFSEDPSQIDLADGIIERVMEGQNVLVNLPAQIYTITKGWLDKTGVLDTEFQEALLEDCTLEEVELPELLEAELGNFSEEEKQELTLGTAPEARSDRSRKQKKGKTQFDGTLEFVKWFVCTGEPDSVALLQRSFQDWGEKMTHVIVKNHGATERPDFSGLETGEIAKLAVEFPTRQLDFPKLLLGTGRGKFLSLFKHRSLQEAVSTKAAGWTVMDRQRVSSFLKASHGEISRVGILPPLESKPPEKGTKSKSAA